MLLLLLLRWSNYAELQAVISLPLASRLPVRPLSPCFPAHGRPYFYQHPVAGSPHARQYVNHWVYYMQPTLLAVIHGYRCCREIIYKLSWRVALLRSARCCCGCCWCNYWWLWWWSEGGGGGPCIWSIIHPCSFAIHISCSSITLHQAPVHHKHSMVALFTFVHTPDKIITGFFSRCATLGQKVGVLIVKHQNWAEVEMFTGSMKKKKWPKWFSSIHAPLQAIKCLCSFSHGIAQ